MTRRWWLVLVGTLAVVVAGLGVPAAAGAAVDQGGQRLMVASATLADPADCADGECDALYITAARGVLGAANSKVAVPGVVLVEAYPSAVFEGGLLFPIGEALFRGCTTEVEVLVRNLTSGRVSTHGAVPLREFVDNEDGTFECAAPVGHTLDLRATFTGVGRVMTTLNRGTYGSTWEHVVEGSKEDLREATAVVSGSVDGEGLWPVSSGNLLRVNARSLVVEHRTSIGPTVRGPIRVPAKATLIKSASGWTGDWSVDAQIMRDPNGEGKAFLFVSGKVGDEPCWADMEPTSITLADDVSAGSATGSGTLYCGESGEEQGPVTVAATWAGVGNAWRYWRTFVDHSPEGSATTRIAGIHRAAALTLVVNGETLPEGEGYLEAFTIKTTATEG